jgi:hypothetical protein
MRLLDRVAGCHAPLLVALDRRPAVPYEVSGPGKFATQVAGCPLRFVLGDDLTRACAELAFADGARLAGCLDLVRIPARHLWVEWNDEVHQRVIHETQSIACDAAVSGRRVGVLLRGTQDGYGSVARTFWANGAASADITLSPLETHIDLRGEFTKGSGPGRVSGGFLSVGQSDSSAMTTLLNHVRFRFDPTWESFYRDAATDWAAQRLIVRGSLAAVCWDPPLLLAFFLLLGAKDATRSAPVSRATINRKRVAHGHAPLLDHLEVRASLDRVEDSGPVGAEAAGRRTPRLHHVRGHLVRRDSRVFWRQPHLRGSASCGIVRSRTVCLSFARLPGPTVAHAHRNQARSKMGQL